LFVGGSGEELPGNKGKSFFSNFCSLPVMFGRKMFLEIETRGLVSFSGGCLAGIP
jgi:hypothetical protein